MGGGQLIKRDGISGTIMKRKRILYTLALLCAASFIMLSDEKSIQAAEKKTVKASIKGKTLTVSGEGAMPSSLRLKGKKANKIKKVIIKKGITAVPKKAFSNYKNVEEITVPASVKTIGQNAFACEKLKKLTVPGNFKVKVDPEKKTACASIAGKVKTVSFNTDFKLETAAYFRAEKLIIKKNDPNYRSIDGVVYSKNGKELVRVPFGRKELKIAEGCEVFCLQAVMYGNENLVGKSSGGCSVKKITIPASVKSVESARYARAAGKTLGSHTPGYEYVEKNLEVIVESKQLDGQSFTELIYRLGMGVEDLQKQVPEQILYEDGMYVTSDDHLLLKYKGENSTVTIPSHIRKVGDYAFFNNKKITKLVLEQGVEEIGKESFKLNEIERLVIPDSVKKIKKGAFAYNPVKSLVIGNQVTEIGDEAFFGNKAKKIVLPPSVKKVGAIAFVGEEIKGTIEVQGSSKEISDQAFPWAGRILSYKKGAKEKKVSIKSILIRSYGKKGKAEIDMYWSKVKGVMGYEAVVSTDAKFTVNKKKIKLKASQTSANIMVKTNGNKNFSIYVKIRPYTIQKGKKIYGRWSKEIVRK